MRVRDGFRMDLEVEVLWALPEEDEEAVLRAARAFEDEQAVPEALRAPTISAVHLVAARFYVEDFSKERDRVCALIREELNSDAFGYEPHTVSILSAEPIGWRRYNSEDLQDREAIELIERRMNEISL